jgi:hypothetical protein
MRGWCWAGTLCTGRDPRAAGVHVAGVLGSDHPQNAYQNHTGGRGAQQGHESPEATAVADFDTECERHTPEDASPRPYVASRSSAGPEPESDDAPPVDAPAQAGSARDPRLERSEPRPPQRLGRAVSLSTARSSRALRFAACRVLSPGSGWTRAHHRAFQPKAVLRDGAELGDP